MILINKTTFFRRKQGVCSIVFHYQNRRKHKENENNVNQRREKTWIQCYSIKTYLCSNLYLGTKSFPAYYVRTVILPHVGWIRCCLNLGRKCLSAPTPSVLYCRAITRSNSYKKLFVYLWSVQCNSNTLDYFSR